MTMPKIILTRGMQASGKTTYAKEWVTAEPGRVRVSRDDTRTMLAGTTATLLPHRAEEVVTTITVEGAKAALKQGFDVIVDDMNLRARYVRSWHRLGYPVEHVDFPISLAEAIARNAQRPNPIPDDVLTKTFRRLTDNGTPRPVSIDAVDAPARLAPEPYVLPAGRSSAYIFDIDGTLAHHGDRSPYDMTRVEEDTVDDAVRQLLDALAYQGYRIILVSGRTEAGRAGTIRWLLRHRINYDALYMRADGDARPDDEMKLDIFNTHIRHNYRVHGVIDDRNRVVAMWRTLGIKCFQAQEGNF